MNNSIFACIYGHPLETEGQDCAECKKLEEAIENSPARIPDEDDGA